MAKKTLTPAEAAAVKPNFISIEISVTLASEEYRWHDGCVYGQGSMTVTVPNGMFDKPNLNRAFEVLEAEARAKFAEAAAKAQVDAEAARLAAEMTVPVETA